MKKELLLLSILAVFMLLAISVVSAVSTQKTNDVEKKVSPLFEIRRTRKTMGERADELKESIRARSIGGRLFFLTLFIRSQDSSVTDNVPVRQQLERKCSITWYGVLTSCWMP